MESVRNAREYARFNFFSLVTMRSIFVATACKATYLAARMGKNKLQRRRVNRDYRWKTVMNTWNRTIEARYIVFAI